MKVTINMELVPFTVPNFVFVALPPGKREDGVKELPKYAIHELDEGKLKELCAQFTDAVLAKKRNHAKDEADLMRLNKP